MTTLPLLQSTDAPDSWWQKRAGWIYDALLQGELPDQDARTPTQYPVSTEPLGTGPYPVAGSSPPTPT